MTSIEIVPLPRTACDQVAEWYLETHRMHSAELPNEFLEARAPHRRSIFIDPMFSRPFGRALDESMNAFAALVDGNLAGYVILSPEFAASSPPVQISIQDIFVAHEHRGKGIGKALLDHVLTEAENKGIAAVDAHIWAKNDQSASLFQAAGFSPHLRSYIFRTSHPTSDANIFGSGIRYNWWDFVKIVGLIAIGAFIYTMARWYWLTFL